MNTIGPGEREQVFLAVHKHWASYAGDILAALSFVFFGVGLVILGQNFPASIFHALSSLLFPCFLLVAWMKLALIWMNHSLTLFVLTDQHIYYLRQQGLFARNVTVWNLRDVAEVSTVRGSFLESYFNFGAIDLRTHGGGEIAISGVPDAEYISSIVLKQEEQRDDLLVDAQKQKELLAYISHEVKGHLTKNKAMFASIVEGDFGPVPDMLNKMAQAALSDTEKGVETVMSILRAPGGAEETMRLDMRPFDLSTLVFEVVDGLRASIVQKGLELRIQIEPKRIVVGDAQKIAHMVVRNLVENAIHYTASGSISVNVKSTGKTALLTVSDTGVGIGKKDMERLFTKGGHGHDSLSMNRDSTGYGLFIAQQVMKAHGGKISVESEGEGKGSRFTTEFPLSS
ncbi:MAG: hypothetical protein RIQ56_72 [Candidatus Parcubacteria bacterium]